MLLPYAPAGLARIAPQYRDPKNPPAWVGMDVWGATICFNTVEAAEAEHSEARDVEGPDQAGVQGPDRDAASGVVGHRLLRRHRVAADVRRGRGLEVHGRTAREHRAVHALGLAPLRGRRRGEYVVGISFEYRANREKARGAPIDLVFPKEGLGWDLEAIGIVKTHDRSSTPRRSSSTGRSRTPRWRSTRTNFAIVAVPALSQAAAERAGRLREPPREERLRVGGEEPRQDPRRVEQAVRVEGGAEVAYVARGRCGASSPSPAGRAFAGLERAAAPAQSGGLHAHARSQ